MRIAMVCFYVSLALMNLAQAVAAGLFGYVPADSAVACAAFIGASGVFIYYAKSLVEGR